ncbi:MAG: protein NosL [bacterium]|nr:protein NosL [bacterium]
MRQFVILAAVFLMGVVLFSGCSPSEKTGPKEVRWDREMCVRCLMAVSDKTFSAQIRGAQEGKRTKVYFFDDLGCAVLWLDEQKWKNGPRTEIWVTNYKDGSWIDATKCFYSKGHITPMDFELGAQVESGQGTLNYEQACEHIRNRGQQSH